MTSKRQPVQPGDLVTSVPGESICERGMRIDPVSFAVSISEKTMAFVVMTWQILSRAIYVY